MTPTDTLQPPPPLPPTYLMYGPLPQNIQIKEQYLLCCIRFQYV